MRISKSPPDVASGSRLTEANKRDRANAYLPNLKFKDCKEDFYLSACGCKNDMKRHDFPHVHLKKVYCIDLTPNSISAVSI